MTREFLSWWVTRSIILILCSFSLAFAKGTERDPNQVSVLIFDFDGTLANFNAYRIYRVDRLLDPFAPDVSQMPAEIRVPAADFESPTGPRVQDHLGKFVNGQFLRSASLEPITLSNGKTIVPAYYYLDPNRSYAEFGRSNDPADAMVARVIAKLKTREPFLMGAYPFFSLAQYPEYHDMILPLVLTLGGQEPSDMRGFFEKVQRSLVQPLRKLSDNQLVTLNHPKSMQFGGDKINYTREVFKELSERVITNHETPHYIVAFENDRTHLARYDEEFRSISARGSFANPVIPILVNLVESEVLDAPQGRDWDRSTLETGRPMARVTIYWPDGVERTSDLERVFQLITGEKSPKKYKQNSNRLMCRGIL